MVQSKFAELLNKKQAVIEIDLKESFKAKLIQKLLERKINFAPTNQGNYIDDEFDNIFEVIYETVFKTE